MADIPESTKSEHVVWTVDATSYLRNLDSEDLRAETFAVHHQAAPEEAETGTRISLRFPTLIVSGYCSEPREVADRVARILNAHWDEPAAPPAMDREAVERKFWLIIREPGRVPDRKGPWPLEQTASILREFMAANPNSFIDYLTIGPDGSPYVDHGPEVLQMADGRSMSVGRKHNDRVREAAIAALSTLSADAIRQGEGWQPIETAVLWDVYVVTDGLNVAMSQYAESDHGDRYWAVEPEDALEWVPTHCIATPASHASDGGKA